MVNLQIDQYVLDKTHKTDVYYLTIEFNRKLTILIIYNFEKILVTGPPRPKKKKKKI